MQSSASAESPQTFRVVHTTKYLYAELAAVSHHLARLAPRALSRQQCSEHGLDITPAPAAQSTHTDYFGNAVTFFAMQGPHKELTVTARSTVTLNPAPPIAPGDTPPWEEITDLSRLPLDAIDCVFDSPAIQTSRDLLEYARPSFGEGRPLLEAVMDLTRRIYDDFTFDPEATTVTTPLAEVFQLKRGVCQDFARLEIGCLRSLGLPAHYVSGYLETLPPPGTPRRVGADASHAWLAVYCPPIGWIDVDPTNNLLPSASHITLAWGRDYVDVSPLRGVILGGGDHALEVSVDVARA